MDSLILLLLSVLWTLILLPVFQVLLFSSTYFSNVIEITFCEKTDSVFGGEIKIFQNLNNSKQPQTS